MAKLEIPSIVVDKGSQPGGSVKALHKMESQRSLRSQRTLSKQEEIDEDDHIDMGSRTDVPTIANPEDQQQLPIRPTNLNMLHRSRSHSKVKLLVRSHAMREESPDGGAGGSDCEGEGNRVGRHRLRREGSSTDQTSWSEPALSRGNSREQYDASNNPIDLHQFIVDTLNRNYKDRMLLFKIEGELLGLARDSKRYSHKFNQMSSYQRMLVHRVAAYFGMEHNVDNTGMSVVVNTTKTLNIPERRFRDFVREDLLEEPRRSILKRDSSSFDETGSFKNGDKMFNGDSRRSRSFEEREEEYEKVRRRIFNHEHLTDADLECMEEYHNWENEGSNGCPRCAHNQPERNVRLLKVESYESGDTLKANSLRLSVSKSHSFNGYDQNNAQPPQPPRVLTKQDSGSSMSSRISPSSSGYKSQRSDATLSATPSPSATPSLHTQTGQPYTNADGSIYHYDPANPPHCVSEQVSTSVPSPQHVQQAPPPNPQPPPPPPPVSLPPPAQLPLPAPLPPHKQVVEEVVGNNEKMGPNNERPGPRFEAIPGYAPVPTSPTGLYTAAYAPPPPPQHQLPLVVPPHPPDQYHIYQAPSHHCPTLPAPQPEPRLPPPPDNGAIINNDLSACMMGMTLEGRPDRQQPIMYWQPHHIQGGVPMYYSGAGHTAAAAANATRYHQAVTSAPPFTSIVPHQIPAPPPPSVEHTGTTFFAGSCYGTTYPAAASPSGPASPECIPPYPSTIHTLYYPTCTSAGSVAGGSTYYGSTNVTPGAPHAPNVQPLVAAAQSPTPIPYQPAQQCGHPPSPQNVCGQLTVYNGCYPAATHYTANSATIAAVPQMFRKPSLQQVGVGCSSPLRATGYPMTSTVKERSIEESKAAAAAMQPTLPPTAVYGIRVLPAGDMRLFNTARLPFPIPGSKPIRKPRGYSAPHHVSHLPRLHQNGGQDIVWNSNKPQRGLPNRHDAHFFHRFKMTGGGIRNFTSEGASHSGPPMSGPYGPATSSDLTKA